MTQTTTPEHEEFCTEVTKRISMLEAVREEPLTLKQLDDRLSTSRSTIHRTIQSFEEQGLIRKEDRSYALTGFGRIVADEATTFRDRLTTVQRLGDFLSIVHPSEVDVPLEHFTDATVTRPTPQQAHTGVKRILDVIEEAESLRMFSNIISPLYVDVALREMLEGTDIEVIFDTSVVDIIEAEYVDQALRAFETGQFTVYVGQDVPFELFINGETMAMAAHDNSARPHMVVESDSPGAVEWAKELYYEYRQEATRVDPDSLAELDRETD